MRFAIAAGGTGGHLFPGLAVAEVLHAAGHQVMVLTSEKHIDAVATEGRSEFRIERLPGIGLPRRLSLEALRCVFRFSRGVMHCFSLFSEFQPAAVLGMGGFTSTAPILAGRLRGLPVFVHESNAIPGKANRLNARIAGGLLVGFEDCIAKAGGVRCQWTGTPIREALRLHPEAQEARARFGLHPDRKTLLVMGGSQGAQGVNTATLGAAKLLGARGIQMIHITGAADEARVREGYRALGIPAWVGAFHHAMQDAYSAAHGVIARSGAASLTELAHFQLPSILIPYPHAADDHQTLNARVFERAGAGVLVPEREATPERLAEAIGKMLQPETAASMASACGRLNVPDAAQRVAQVLLAATTSREGGAR